MSAWVMPLAFALVFAVGFAVHRASLCNVRAVADLMERHDPRMLGSFLKAAAWTALVSGALLLAMQGMPHAALQRTPLALALLGGALFGIGAAINGGCSLSTLQRLADGELAMVATVLAFCGGLLAWWAWLAPRWPMAGTRELGFALAPGRPWAGVALALLSAWAVWELTRLWRSTDEPWHRRLRATPWRPASAAAVLGIAGGLLYTLQGTWTWTSLLDREAGAWIGRTMAPMAMQLLLVLALLAGMVLSSWQRGGFALRRPRGAMLARVATGGALMGLGAAMLPGGNDTVVLVSLPTLAPSALAVYAAMLAGIATTLWLQRRRA